MKSSNVISLLTFFSVAMVVAHTVYSKRKDNQKTEELKFAVSHPMRTIDVLASAPSSNEDKVMANVLASGHSFGKHLPHWAKRKLQKLISQNHSN